MEKYSTCLKKESNVSTGTMGRNSEVITLYVNKRKSNKPRNVQESLLVLIVVVFVVDILVVVVMCGESCLPLFAGSVLSPLGVASMHSYGSQELDDEKGITSPSPEGIGVVGIGTFWDNQLLISIVFFSFSRFLFIIFNYSSKQNNLLLFLNFFGVYSKKNVGYVYFACCKKIIQNMNFCVSPNHHVHWLYHPVM